LHQFTQIEGTKTAEQFQKISASDQRDCKVQRTLISFYLKPSTSDRDENQKHSGQRNGLGISQVFRVTSGQRERVQDASHPICFKSDSNLNQFSEKEASRRNEIMIDSERASQFSASLIDSQGF
jgi:hypothetical protein